MVKASLRTKSVGTKVSDEEFAALEARARAENLTLSEWMRAKLLEPDTNGGEAAGELVGEVLLSEVLALRALFLNLRPLPDHALPGEAEVRAEIARVDATRCSGRGSGWRRRKRRARRGDEGLVRSAPVLEVDALDADSGGRFLLCSLRSVLPERVERGGAS